MASVFAHIVTFNSAQFIGRTLGALHQQRALDRLEVLVTDNASTDGTAEAVRSIFPKATLELNSINIGFCAGHNQGVRRFLQGSAEYLLILNPDLVLESYAIYEMIQAIKRNPSAGMATPRLYRADDELNPVTPRRFDAAGMILDNTLRHFDRGSEQKDIGQLLTEEFVFGGSGAALLLSRHSVENLILEAERDDLVYSIYPELRAGLSQRAQLFDEAFFAYREDAELAWRAKRLGIGCIYAPRAVGYHRRVVLPSRRAQLPVELNLYSVRNRFLMQMLHLSIAADWRTILPGFLMRNLMVILGVLFWERSSIPALAQAFKLMPRCFARRRVLNSRIINQVPRLMQGSSAGY